MLRHLDIRDMLIIDRLELAFQPGLNVLTGETGAGKSILLDALGFVLGWRGRADLVRSGAAQGEVVAEFQIAPDHPARAVLDEAGFPAGDELILRRVNTPEGRKTAWVNDRRASGEVLRRLSDVLVELHGQQDDKGLLDPRNHREMLDDFGGLAGLRADVGAAWGERSKAARALSEAEARLAEMRSEEDFLRHAVAELDKLAPQPGEEAELDQRRRLMQAAEKMRADIARAAAALGLEGAEGMLSDARRWLEGVTDRAEGGLDAAQAALERATVELAEAQGAVEGFADQLVFNPAELEDTEDRLFALRGLARKHGVMPDDLAGLAETLRTRLDQLDGGTDRIAELASALDAAERAYRDVAGRLSQARAEAATRLDVAMARELGPLKMERAVFTTEIAATDPGPTGTDAVTFSVATNPGAPAGPLNRIASGGELSRFLLALKVCLTHDDSGLTMIFDEIDRGVGGATADAVGRRLAALAEGGQVLVVTHSPQVAALGAHHWRVAKDVADGVTTSRVVPLAPAERIDEVARMLSGDTITDAAREAARALLSGA
ncbi:DNA repair protein RecN [Roseibacterium elongatum DSM 19469]|uniref:DNA repair protein RecN n=1 Tax=Roseicyclus elongatus DSM 19469 TaxID=1294273 RepID=W8RWH2_9RHOB|nr:DNA repair protein RecN [Roseibacterium elongatum]AHM05688.1 DNA repair protein RecN [Roseibacterium elongatum DSM 19469]